MIKFCVKFLFSNGSVLVSSSVFDTLREANHHGEFMMSCALWNTPECQIIRFVVGTCEFVF